MVPRGGERLDPVSDLGVEPDGDGLAGGHGGLMVYTRDTLSLTAGMSSSIKPTRWYTADLHLGHERVVSLCDRPFRSASHMDGALIENLWSKVGPGDVLWIVGDFAHGEKAWNDTAWLEGMFGQLPACRSISSSATTTAQPPKGCLGTACTSSSKSRT